MPILLAGSLLLPAELPGEVREGRRVVVIDSGLVADIPREEIADATVFAVDGRRDVVDQISLALRSLDQVDVLQVISHGEDGALRLGGEVIDLGTLEKRAGQIAKWKESLSADAQILLYGCRVAESDHGKKFVKQLAALVGAKVAASTNITGLGGDAQLEFQVGAVTTGLLADVAKYDQAGLSLFLLEDDGFSFEDVKPDWDLDIRTRFSAITSSTNNQNGTITVTMTFDLLGMWWYGYKSTDGWVYMYRDGNEVARKFMETGNNRTFTATFPVTAGERKISVSPRRGIPTSWSDSAQTVSIQAPFYLGSPGAYTVSVGQTLYAVVSCLGTPAVVHTATGLPRGVSMSASGVILGNPATGTAGSYIVNVQANNGFGSTSYSLSVLVTNEAPTFLTTNPGLISGAVEDTPFTVSHATLAAAVDDSDPNGDPLSFRVESVLGGTLTKNGSLVTAGATLVGPGESLVWTPPAGASGNLDGFTVKAYDESLYSTVTKKVGISVSAVNDPPTLTQFSGPVASGNEDSSIVILFAELMTKGDEADIDSTVTGFVVKEVTTGTLRIGTSEATALPWNAISNKGITSSLNGYWTPDPNANGPQAAFRVVARDPGGAESTPPVQVVVTANAVNDPPTLTGMAILSGAAGGSPFEISHAVLAYASDEADVDADPISFRIETVSSGSLDKWMGSAWGAVTTGTTLLSAGEKLRWTPPAGSSGLRNAFTVKAWDGQLASITAVQVRIDGDRWRMVPWGDVASSGIDPAYRYTHAYSFGAGGIFAINGVTFTGIAGANPEVAGRISMTGFGSSVTNDSNLLADSTRALANDAVSSSATAPSVILRGLIPGGRYVLSLFSVGQEGGARMGTFSSALGQITINQNEYGNNQGLRLDYRYVADAAGTVTLQLSVPGNSFFIYGLANREEDMAFGVYGPAGLTYDSAAKAFQARGKPLQLPFVSAGVLHSLVLKSDGTVTAFGSNEYGQSSVPAGLSQVIAVSAGGYHSLALKSNGTVVAWGVNWQGQATVPAGLSDVVAISAGKGHNLALKSDGTVVAWGSNSGGQAAVPADLNGVVAISAGSNHSLALKSDGTVVAWGYGFYNYATPPADLVGVVAISAGEWHSLALKSDGTVVAWGNNGSFQSQVPDGLKGVVAISAGTSHSLALKSDGKIVVWGDRDNYGLGNMPAGLSGVVAIDAGSEHSVALKSDGTVVTFGWCRFGQQYAATPLGPIAAISTGNDHTVALRVDGTVAAWGANTYGQTSVPAGLSGVIAVQAGDQFSIALKSDRTVVGWGGAIGTFSGQVAMPAGLANVVQISASEDHALALKADGTVVAWGDNYYSQSIVPAGLNNVTAVAAGGRGSLALKRDGTVVYWGLDLGGRGAVPAGLSDVTAIAAGGDFSMALKRDGTVVVWGDNKYGQLNVPVGLTNVVAIEAGLYHSLALKSDGTIVAWGNSTEVSSSANGVGVISLAAGYNNSIALKSDGTIIAWGNNHRGQNNPPLAASLPAVGLADQMSALNPSGLTYTGRGSTVYASSTNPPTVAGDYTVSVTGGGAGNIYSVSENFTIAKVTPTISYSSQVKTIAYGSPLTSSQVGSSGAWAVVGNSFQVIPGRNIFSPAVGAVLPAGTHSLQVTFLPTDSVNFNPAVATGTVTVTKATVAPANISFVAPDSLTYNGTTKPYTASATGVAGFTYNYSGRAGTAYGPSTTAPTYAGDYTVTATVNDPNYQGSKSLDFTIARATPTIFVNPVSSLLTFGQSLASATLSGGTASVPGAFSFASTGTVPSAGTLAYEVVFTPTDTANYTTASTMLQVTVEPLVIATGAFTISSPASLVYNGSPKWHSATAVGPYGTLASFIYNYVGVGGTTYGPSETAPTQAGNYKVTAILLGPNFYGTAAKNFTITKSAITLNWASPADIAYGTALTATQLNATANVPGTFAYTPAAGTVLGAGARTLEVAFTPTDTTNYLSASSSVPLKVTTTSLPISLLPPSLVYDGTAKGYVLSQMAYVSSGWDHSLALKVDGTVVAWGSNTYANGYPHNATVVPAGLSGVVQVSAGDYHSVAVKSDGKLVSWGSNDSYQSTGAVLNLPYTGPGWTAITQRDVITNAVAADAGGKLTVVLRADGTVTVLADITASVANVPSGLSGVIAVAAGYLHAVALKSDGTVVAWGSNAYGQADVPAGLSNVVAIAAGGNHTLALKADGTVVAWGNDSTGQATVPAGLSGVVAITAGFSTSFALKADGTVIAWGLYSGRGGVEFVGSGSGVVAFSSDANGKLQLLRSNGTVKAVDGTILATGIGFPAYSVSYAGRSGTTYPASSTPPTNAGNYAVTVTSTNPNYNATKTVDFTIAKAAPTITTQPQASILTAGQALSAALLDGGVASVPGTFSFTTPSLVPPVGTTLQATLFTPTDASNYAVVPGTVAVRSSRTTASVPSILSLPTAAPITFGQRLQASVLSSGAASVPGTFVYTSRLTVPNPGTTSQSVTFVPDDIASYAAVTMFVPLTVYDGIMSPLNIPIVPPASLVYDGSPKAFTASRSQLLSGYRDHVLIVNNDGTVKAFGDNSLGGCDVPAGLSGVVAVSAGDSISLALKSDGTVVEWGGDAGWGPLFGRPPAGLTGVVAIARSSHGLALKSDGTVVAWGDNSSGKATVPAGINSVVAIAASDYASFALKSDGTVVAWGGNPYGELNIPVGLNGVIAIDAGPYGGVVALKADGTVVVWGGGPTAPSGLSGVVAVAAGRSHMTALKSDGSVVAWGDNTVFSPTGANTNLVPWNASGVVAISAGSNKTYALKADGSVVWWGQGSEQGAYRVNGEVVRTPGGGGYSVPAATMVVGASAGFAFTTIYTGREGTTYAASATPPTNPGDYSVTVTGTNSAFTTPKTYAFSIAKATPAITAMPTATGITFGQALADSILSGGTTSVPGTFAFSTPASIPNAGNQGQSVVFTPSDTGKYLPVTLTVPVTVGKANPVLIALPNATSLQFGQNLADALFGSGSGSVQGVFSFTSAGTAPGLGLSSHEILFTPLDSVNYAPVTASVNVLVNRALPSILTLPVASPIAYGQSLADSALTGGVASVAGSFAWVYAGTTPGTGTAPQEFVFTPEDSTNYSTVSGSVIVTVNPATPTVVVAPTATPITYGQTLANSTLSGGACSVPGSFAWVTAGAAPNAGTRAQSFVFVPEDTTNYRSVTGSVSVQVNQAVATVTSENLSTVYDGTAKAVSVTTTPPGLLVKVAYNGQSSAPVEAGRYEILATIDNENYTGWKSMILSITPKPLTVSGLTAVSRAYNGTRDCSLTGNPVYVGLVEGEEFAVLGTPAATFSDAQAGTSKVVSVSGLEAPTSNYRVTQPSLLADITKATPEVTWPSASAISRGQALSEATLTGGSVNGTFAFTTPFMVPNAGPSQSFNVIFIPTDADNYSTVIAPVSVTVEKVTPTIVTVPTTTPITYGQTLADSTLMGGVGSVSGWFEWANADTVPNAGTVAQDFVTAQTFVFVPYDTMNYVSVTGSVAVEVSQAAATVTLGNLSAEYDGVAKPVSVTTTPPGLTVNVAYNGQSSPPVQAGRYEVIATIDDANYAGSKSMDLTIAPKTVTVTAAARTKEYGAEEEPGLTYVSSGLLGSDALTGSLSRESGEDVGTYAITLGSLNAGNNYTIDYVGAVFTITAAALPEAAWTVFPPTSLEYNGTAKTHMALAGGAGPSLYSSTVFSYLYEGRNGTSYAAQATAPTQAGDYRLTTTASGNYVGTRQTDFSITPKMLTVSGLTAVSRAYNGTTNCSLTGTAAYSGLVNGEEFAVLGTPVATFADAVVETNKAVTVTGLAAPTANYQVTQPSLLADITKATLIPAWSGATLVVFDGSAHALTASTSPATSMSVTYNGSATAPTQVGVYTVVATVLDANYEGTATATLEIQAKSVTSWAEESGLTGAAAAPTADPDGDGLNNATEFAFGTSPSGAGNSEICEMLPAEEGKMAVGFLRRVSGAEATYQARVFTDLSSGFSGGTLLTPVRSADQTGVPPGYERVEVQAPTTGERGFIQVQAEVP